MGPFIIRRLLWTVLLLILISGITFLIFYELPTADPAALRAGRSPTPETLALIREQLGLDKAWYSQLGTFLSDLFFHFDFGTSYVNDLPVREQLVRAASRPPGSSSSAPLSSGSSSASRSASSARSSAARSGTGC